MNSTDRTLTARYEPAPSVSSEVLVREGSNGSLGNHRYVFLWDQIRQRAPEAVLLRGPSELNPVQAVGEGDLDILLTSDHAAVETFLARQGFHRSYKPQAYLRRFQLFLTEASTPYTIELYSAERWGLGFQLARKNHHPADPDLARLLHATADGKGVTLLPTRTNSQEQSALTGSIGRALWKGGNTKLLTLYLLLTGLIRPDLRMIGKSLLRRVGYRLWQLSHKAGLEVGIVGPDGAGKSSLARALLSLPVPVRVIYMGYNECQTAVMAFARKRKLPPPLQKMAAGYDFFMRRLRGWLLSRRGWVVVYDRHPAERLIVQPAGFLQRIANSFKRLYAWPLDLTFWLTGDYEKIYVRKKEQSAAELEQMDRQFREVLRSYAIPFEKIDVTNKDQESVFKIVAERILSGYRHRHSIDNLEGLARTVLK
jgi:thymidylate kinase